MLINYSGKWLGAERISIRLLGIRYQAGITIFENELSIDSHWIEMD